MTEGMYEAQASGGISSNPVFGGSLSIPVVTGPEYLHALAGLGYNVENMTSSLPTITKIAEAGASFLNNQYTQQLAFQKSQADIALSHANAEHIDSLTAYNNQALGRQLTALDYQNQKLGVEAEIAKATQQNQIERDNLLTQDRKEQVRHQGALNPLLETEQDQKNKLTGIDLQQAQQQQDENNRAIAEWEKNYSSYPDPTKPGYREAQAQWLNDNRLSANNIRTRDKINNLIARSDQVYASLSANQVRDNLVSQGTALQKENRISGLYDFDSLVANNPDEARSQIVQGNLSKTFDALQEAYTGIVQAGGGFMGAQSKAVADELASAIHQIDSFKNNPDEIQNIKRNGNSWIDQEGKPKGTLTGLLQRGAFLNQLLGKKEVVTPKVEVQLPGPGFVPGAGRGQPMTTITASPEDAAIYNAHPENFSTAFDAQGNLTVYNKLTGESKQVTPAGAGAAAVTSAVTGGQGITGQPIRPTPQTPQLSPAEIQARTDYGNAVLKQDSSADAKSLVADYIAGRINDAQMKDSLLRHWSGQSISDQTDKTSKPPPNAAGTPENKPSRADEARIPVSQSNGYHYPDGAADIAGIDRNVWANVLAEEGPEKSVDMDSAGVGHNSIFGMWEDKAGPEANAYDTAARTGSNSLETYNTVTQAWARWAANSGADPWKLNNPGLQELVLADVQHTGGSKDVGNLIHDLGGFEALNSMDPSTAINLYSRARQGFWRTNPGRVAREQAWALRNNQVLRGKG